MQPLPIQAPQILYAPVFFFSQYFSIHLLPHAHNSCSTHNESGQWFPWLLGSFFTVTFRAHIIRCRDCDGDGHECKAGVCKGHLLMWAGKTLNDWIPEAWMSHQSWLFRTEEGVLCKHWSLDSIVRAWLCIMTPRGQYELMEVMFFTDCRDLGTDTKHSWVWFQLGYVWMHFQNSYKQIFDNKLFSVCQ